ncbi:vacuolar protein sorting-associated protein 36 isoform X1 [Selaginella moellendorffii]|uniref:vacuolar protein sorting-associated protein 36 isoform X1 n=1 Tax=Selaginella moellendorffii TaxID=88036 RepID=UPI000D1C8B32|nr:vacuolar protein sorting-associated protein 36 isoform X1 [Selaginella moellendorffii]|eukprot:XP_024523405.1 vacuolar protein sorting-associated protein 36 isoform X1 [Selaginella moellendorffii]
MGRAGAHEWGCRGGGAALTRHVPALPGVEAAAADQERERYSHGGHGSHCGDCQSRGALPGAVRGGCIQGHGRGGQIHPRVQGPVFRGVVHGQTRVLGGLRPGQGAGFQGSRGSTLSDMLIVEKYIRSCHSFPMGSGSRWAERLLESGALSDAGRPLLGPGEVECQLLDGVDIEVVDSGVEGDPLRSGLLILTNARMFWVHQHSRSAFFLPLSSVSRISAPRKGLKSVFSSTLRLRVYVWTCANGKLCLQGAAAAHSSVTLLLSFRGHASSFDNLVSQLGAVLQSRAWETLPAAAVNPSTASASTPSSHWNPSRAGVSGILRKEQEQWEQTDKNLQEAFHDLNALMGKAKEMVLLADKMRARLLTEGSASGSQQELHDLLLSVGIASPVTKESAGALYHQQLSRQLADFVGSPLQSAGGMLALVDVYCLFNRARGTELISPEDLLQACDLWDRLDVPVMLRRFDSGALAIQIKSKSDDEVVARIMRLVDDLRTGVGAREAAKCLGVAPALAKEHLFSAEARGFLCRDDGPDGLRFYTNFFKDAQFP